MAEVRREEALRAARVLGVKEVLFLDEPDAADEINTSMVKQKLTEIIARLQPTEVYSLHAELDRHPAHRLAGRLVRKSLVETGLTPSGGLWAYEVWGLFTTWDRLEYIDGYVGKMSLAIAEHRSQVATIPYGDGVLGLNRWRAVFADPKATAPGGVYAEVFLRVGAMLNTRQGGIVFYGVEDNGDIQGSDLTRQQFDQMLQNSIKNSISPAAVVTLQSVSVLGSEILVVIVPPWNRWDVYQFDEKVLIRKGTNDFAAKPEELRKLHRGEYVI